MANKSTPDAPSNAPQTVDLSAKLHQAHDPSTEFKDSGNILGNALVTEEPEKVEQEKLKKSDSGSSFLAKLADAVNELTQQNQQETLTTENSTPPTVNRESSQPPSSSSSYNSIQMDGNLSPNPMSYRCTRRLPKRHRASSDAKPSRR